MVKDNIYSAGITLYHPSEEQISKIVCYSKCFTYVFIYDNTEDKDLYNYVFPKNVFYFSRRQNDGLPVAFNYIMNKSLEVGADFLCTLDQDSTYLSQDVFSMQLFINSFSNSNNVGIFAPYIDYGYSNQKKRTGYTFKKWAITSGSFVNIKLAKSLGIEYDDNYFIDKFEIDLCQNFRTKKCVVVMYYGSTLHQKLGEISKKGYSQHSSLRHYYIFRNRFYFNKKWFGFLKRSILNFLQTMRHIFRIYIREDNPNDKIRMLYLAKQDFKHGRLGKISER